jgi:hypothetical protein
MTAPHPNEREAPFCQEAVPTFHSFIGECQQLCEQQETGRRCLLIRCARCCFRITKVRYLVDSAAHLGRFYLSERSVDEEGKTIWLEGPDGRLFSASDKLPVLSRTGARISLTGADVVLVWLVQPQREPDEVRMGLKYLSQWPEGPQASLARMGR